MTTNDDNQLSPAGLRWLARPTTDVGPATPAPAWCAPAAAEQLTAADVLGGQA
ncbi:hypothetical protein NJB1507_36890 [Mycobacterium marinum]|uniref:hypothetical protein n=1 Tax=Mycobacterium marinum TaxID=1781 RepID=UPI0021C423F2|nr:hypothetical protein [Mycobacterium marinum]GJO29578.1 hypothetical protein NJB1507_36890 [Mycobacterium marinum]